MSVGDLLTGADYELEYNDVLFGDDDIRVIAVEMFQLPGLRTSDQNRPRRHGMFAGSDYMAARSVIVDLEIWHTTNADFRTRVEEVLSASVPQSSTELGLAMKLPEWPDTLLFYCRPRRRSGPVIDEAYGFRTATCSIEFVGTDPRLYSLTEHSTAIDVEPSSTTGLSFDAPAPFTFGAAALPDSTNVVNGGNFDTYPTVTIEGPVTNPFIENQTTGAAVTLTGAVAEGDTLTVDFTDRSVFLNGTTNRFNLVDADADFFVLPPGATSIRFGGQVPVSKTSTFTIRWRDAWV